MADRFSQTPWSQRLDKLRTRGRSTLRAALGTSAEAAPAALPTMQGEALARHHLGLAIDALREQALSKTESFRTLRLMINKLEQGGPRRKTQQRDVSPARVPQQPLTLNRRARLLNRAFEGANMIAGWRAERTARDSPRP